MGYQLQINVSTLTAEQIISLARTAPVNLIRRREMGDDNLSSLDAMLPVNPIERGILFGICRFGKLAGGNTIEEIYRNSISGVTVSTFSTHGWFWYHPQWGVFKDILESLGQMQSFEVQSSQRIKYSDLVTLVREGETAASNLEQLFKFVTPGYNPVEQAVITQDSFLQVIYKVFSFSKKQWLDVILRRLNSGKHTSRELLVLLCQNYGISAREVVGVTRHSTSMLLYATAPSIWSDYCTPADRYSLMYKWAHRAIRHHEINTLLSFPPDWLNPYFRPKKLGPLLHSLYRVARPTANLYPYRQVVALLDYVRTYLPTRQWDHTAIVSALGLEVSVQAYTICTREQRAQITSLLKAGLRLECCSPKLIDVIFGSQHEYIHQLSIL